MDRAKQRDLAERLRARHHGPGILVLPNAWDVASAVVFAGAGFDAVGTSSAGVAAVLGYPDGERIPRDSMLAMVERIAGAIDLPVTADMEAGYGDSSEAMATLAEGLIAAGAVGLNLEDTASSGPDPLQEVAAQVAKIRALREVAATGGVPLVLNARTDVYLLEVGPAEQRFDETVRRLNAYREAGADCLFAPGVRDAATIQRLAAALDGPLNVLVGPGTPPTQELERLGVARVSMGSGPMRAALAAARRVATELREHGTYTSFTENVPTHAEVNRLMERGTESSRPPSSTIC